jgi:hypothetical protein
MAFGRYLARGESRGAADQHTSTQITAQHCAYALRAAGVTATLIQLGPVDHDTWDFLALPRIVRWFLHLN